MQLALSLLGRMEVTWAGQPISFATTAVRALLAYLALDGDRPQARELLAALLWPELTQAAAFNNLRQTLSRLRKALPDPAARAVLTVTPQTLQFNRAVATVDVARFEDLLAECGVHAHADLTVCSACRARLEQAAALYRGELLHGLHMEHSQPFDEWLLFKREELHRQALAVLDTLARAHEAAGNYAEMRRHAARQVALEPWREEAHAQVMRALAATGQRAAALAQYATCCRILRAELGVEPSPELTALHEQLKAGAPISTPQPAPPTGGARVGPARHASSGAPDTGALYGRTAEVAQLEQWLVHDRCRLVAVLGMGGVGKTALVATVVRTAASHFDTVIWRSLLNAPPLDELLSAILQTLSEQRLAALPTGFDDQVELLLDHLRRARCLLVLDNLESMLDAGAAGAYRADYALYGQLLHELAAREHRSCLLLTSRERPQGLARWEAELPAVRALRLEGLDAVAGAAILAGRGLTGQEADARALVERYSGHPLALKLVAQTVHELFGGTIGDFLREETLIFDDFRAVLDQQFARLSALEQEILCWLAIEREAISAATLRANLVQTEPSHTFLEALRALQRRSLLERVGDGFTLQNVVIEYLTERLVDGVCAELRQAAEPASGPGDLEQRSRAVSRSMLNRFALIKAQAKEYVRQSQERMILQPVATQVLAALGGTGLARESQRIIAAMRRVSPLAPGYTAGNILNLLLYAGVDVTGYDFSRLSVWQAYLRGVSLPKVSFAHADLRAAAFTDTFTYVISLAYSPDGRWLAAGLASGDVRLWRVVDGAPIGVCKGHHKHVRSVAFSPDGHRLVSGSDDHTVRLWDAHTGQLLRSLEGHSGRVFSVAFSPDGHTVASSGEDMALCLWDVRAQGRSDPDRTLQGHTGWVWSIALSPDGGRLASGSLDGTVRLWDVRTGQVLHVLEGHGEWVRSVVFSPDGRDLASSSADMTIRVWNAQTGELRHLLHGHTESTNTLAFSPDGATLASGSDDRTIRLWDARTGEPLDLLQGHTAGIYTLAFSPDGATLASGGYDQTIRVWNVRGSGQAITVLQGYSQGVRSVAFSPDGLYLASGGIDDRVRLWDLAHGRVLHSVPGHIQTSGTLAFSSDGTLLVSYGEDLTVRVWHRRSGQVRTIRYDYPSERSALALSPDGTTVATGNFHGEIHLWDTDSGQVYLVLQGHTDNINAIAFSPDGKMLASGGYDAHIRLWHIRGRRTLASTWSEQCEHEDCLHLLKEHAGWVWSVAFSPDGESLASSSSDRTIRLWHVRTGQTYRIFRGHTEWVFGVAFSPNGKTLASCSADQTVRVWDVETGACLHTLHGHTSWVWSIAFHPDGKTVATGSLDETIKLWDISLGICLETLRAPGPYADMDITGATGITEAQRAALKALGAVEDVHNLLEMVARGRGEPIPSAF